MKYQVLQAGFNGEHVVYETEDKKVADKIAAEHSARRVEIVKEPK